MKAFYTLVLLLFLASCSGSEVPVENPTVADVSVQETVDDIETATSELTEENTEVEIVPEPESRETESTPETVEVSESQSFDEWNPDVWEASPESTSSEAEDTAEAGEVSESNPEASSDEQAAVSPKVVELSTTYNNPKMEVVMDIEYSVAEDGTISEISVTSPNYWWMPEFNTWIQAVVWMTVSEASQYNVSWSSLTTPAFQSAMKNG